MLDRIQTGSNLVIVLIDRFYHPAFNTPRFKPRVINNSYEIVNPNINTNESGFV